MIYILLIAYQIKHFIADYPLQGKYMLKKFLPGTEWILPLLAHSSVHAIMTFLIALAVKPHVAFFVAGLDLVLHFTMDRIKASPSMLGRYKPLTAQTYMTSTDEEKKANTYFWWALGLDQGVHHLTHYLIIWILLS